MLTYFIPFAPVLGFATALAIGFSWASYHEHRALQARASKEPRQ